ncbi:hypothetical protein PQX77_007512 [Marasmius sp. AFHP31]|nr:hypothetical protein PQX77_007512 [Marasmius sp. AFHP31]
MFFKLSTVPQLAVVAAMLFAGVANAEQGLAGPPPGPAGLAPPPRTPPSQWLSQPTYRIRLIAAALSVFLVINGINVDATYTDICTGGCIDRPGPGGIDRGIALSDPLYNRLNPGGSDPIFVVWNNLGPQ